VNNRITSSVLFSACLLYLGGCAGLSASQTENISRRSDYFKNPQNNIMAVVDKIGARQLYGVPIQCHVNNSAIMDPESKNYSFDTMTPYVAIFPTGEMLQEIKKKYDNLSEQDKKRMALDPAMAFSMNYVCQSQGSFGIEGLIYFNGKVVASSTANTAYGVVNLSYHFSIVDLLQN